MVCQEKIHGGGGAGRREGFEEASVVQRIEYVGMQRGCMGGSVFWVCDGV